MNIKNWTIAVLFLMLLLAATLGGLATGEIIVLFGMWLLITYLEYR